MNLSWAVIALLALACFLGGGAYSFARQGRRNAMWVLIILTVMSVIAAVLYSLEPV